MAEPRVHATAAAPVPAIRPQRVCIECGEAITAVSGVDYCSSACRHTFNNRLKQRGAILMSLYMVHRYERPLAKAEGVFALINRFAMICRDEDHAQRAGRRSWRPLKAVLADHPNLRAVVVWRGRRKKDVKA